MLPYRCLCLFSCAPLLVVAPARAQIQLDVVPAAYATQDANSYLWVAGASRDVRQQTLVGPSHLAAMLGRSLTALELRRTTANETYHGGTARLTVTLSISPSRPLHCSRTLDANVGPNALQVFHGTVTLPTSPPVPQTTVLWTPQNTLRIAFQTPFVYTGGTLCIDIVGAPIAGQNADWWMADAVFEDIGGTATPRGNGCGSYGGPQHQWSHVSERGLVPGGHVQFFARGTPNALAVCAFGTLSPLPLPLSTLGFMVPGCNLHLASLDAMLVTIFEPETLPAFAAAGGFAEVYLHIPDSTAMFGLTFTTQWLDFGQVAVSNAIEWCVAAVMPQLDMTGIEGHPSEATGEVAVHLAHVLRLEHQ